MTYQVKEYLAETTICVKPDMEYTLCYILKSRFSQKIETLQRFSKCFWRCHRN